jgi:hypothetical protein
MVLAICLATPRCGETKAKARPAGADFRVIPEEEECP